MMKKICILGCPGSGKSTFSRKLHQITDIPLFHLDMLFWNADKTSVDRETLRQRVEEVMQNPAWIIDGNYGATLDQRLSACDTVFLFNLPAEICLAGVEARRGQVRPDMPWIEEEEDPEFTAYIRSFSTDKLPSIDQRLQEYPAITVIRFRSHAEADAYLEGLNSRLTN